VSKTVYMQLINESSRKVVWEEKLEVNNGIADGQIFLPDSLVDGSYLLAAYTQYSFFADKSELKAARRVEIKKSVKFDFGSPTDVGFSKEKKRSIQFSTFPEGGNLVEGIPGKLAFKAVNTDGSPAPVKGALWQDSVLLQKFESAHAGMGSLTFTPLPNKKYTIRIFNPDTLINLPQALPQGITLQLADRNKDYLEFLVSQSPLLPERPIYLRAQMRGLICCMAIATLNRNVRLKIPLKEFPGQGIAEITLFTDSITPVAERLIYVNPEKNLNIEAHLEKDRYPKRGKAMLKIKITDENGQPAVANLGVNIFDRIYQNSNNPENILSHCLISSQLKGKIYEPAYYFDAKNQNRATGLDLLLLTQGWSQYVWNEVSLKENDSKNKPVIFDGIRCKVKATRQKELAGGLQHVVKAFHLAKKTETQMIPADSVGEFVVSPDLLKLWKGDYLYLQPMTSDDFKPKVEITEPFNIINLITKTKEISCPISDIITAKPNLIKESAVAGHRVVKLSTFTFKQKGSTRKGPLKNEGIKGHYYCINGILDCVYHSRDSRNKDITESEYMQLRNYSCVKAYAVRREFYEPKYDIVDSLNFPQNDFRNTLLWKPQVVTDEKGEVSLPFFCSDINTRFVVNIEGTNKDGLLGASRFEFSVFDPKTNK